MLKAAENTINNMNWQQYVKLISLSASPSCLDLLPKLSSLRMIMILRSIHAEQGQPNTVSLSLMNVPGFLTKGTTHTVKPKHLLLSCSSCTFSFTTEMMKVTSK